MTRQNGAVAGDLLFKVFTNREREEMREFSQGLYEHLELWSLSPTYKNLVCQFFTKNLIIVSISSSIYVSYVCDLLGLYILLVNNSIDPKTTY